MSIDQHNGFSRSRQPVSKTDYSAVSKRAAMLAQVDMTRLTRKLARCECGHGPGVHIETGCAMDGCNCNDFVE